MSNTAKCHSMTLSQLHAVAENTVAQRKMLPNAVA